MTRTGWAGLAASHVAVFAVTAWVVRELTWHLHWSANPTGWWWGDKRFGGGEVGDT